jgi:hypothetical protein
MTVVFDGSRRARQAVTDCWDQAAGKDAALLIQVAVSQRLRWWLALARSVPGAFDPAERDLELAVRDEAKDLAHELEAKHPVRWWMVLEA